MISAPAWFEPLVDAEWHRRLLATLDARAGTQRGKPRARDPNRNPLGARIFDMNCGWPMYRIPYGKTFRYGCGCYQQSHGAACDHNYVDGPTASRFLLGCLRQRLLWPTLLTIDLLMFAQVSHRLSYLEVSPRIANVNKPQQRLRQLAANVQDNQQPDQTLARLRAELAQVKSELSTVSGNMARAKTDAQYEAISTVFEELKSRQPSLKAMIAAEESKVCRQVDAETEVCRKVDAETEVAAALNLVCRLADLVADANRLDLAAQVFNLSFNLCFTRPRTSHTLLGKNISFLRVRSITNARLFLRFERVLVKKRLLNKVCGGVVTFGAAPSVKPYTPHGLK